MRDKKEFYGILTELRRKPFSEYQKLVGDFDFSRYVLKVNAVQESPDEGPTVLVIRVPQIIAGFPDRLFSTPVKRTALEDFLTRRMGEYLEALAQYDSQGVSIRRVTIAAPGQKILPRTALVITSEYVEARLYVNLPVEDGHIPGESIRDIFFEDIPGLVSQALVYCNLDALVLDEAINLMEDSNQVRQTLPTRGLIGFIADGSLLSRTVGSDEPDYANMEPLTVAENARVEIDVPNSGSIAGLGVPDGLTVILGDNYSGRVELMHALAAGIYNHVPGDGRELSISVPDAVYVTSEPGRHVHAVDLRAFVNGRIEDQDAAAYSCEQADAFASQAASTVEALEVGARVLLFDESESSASFLLADSRLVPVARSLNQRVIPLSLRARQIVDELGVSIVVAGSACMAEYLPLADTVLLVEDYQVRNITEDVKKMALKTPVPAPADFDVNLLVGNSRWVVPSSIDPSLGQHDAYIDAHNQSQLQFGRSVIDLATIRQLADVHQTATIGLILYYSKLRYMDESRPIREILDLLDRDLSTEGLECLTRELRGDLARPRRYEIAAMMNRLASLRIRAAQQ